METYKFNNKIDCVIRSVSAGELGGIKRRYDNQPYTELKDISAVLNFESHNTAGYDTTTNLLYHHVDAINQVVLQNCPLTRKVLSLIMAPVPTENRYISKKTTITVDSESEALFLPLTSENAYQIFIMNSDGNVVYAMDHLGASESFTPSGGMKPGNSYLVYWYEMASNSYSLDESRPPYVSVDLRSWGNKDDSTTNYMVHLAKCAISINKTIYFNQEEPNTVNLILNVIKPTKEEIAAGKMNFISFN